MLEQIITSEARLKVLRFFFSGGSEFCPYVREVSRGTELEINAVRRELQRLSQAKILLETPRGNRLHYYLNKNHSLYYKLSGIIAMETGLGSVIYKKRKKLGNLNFALLSLDFFSKNEKKGPVDLLLVGKFYMNTLKKIIEEYQEKTGEEVNYMALSEQEFTLLKDRREPVLMASLMQPRCIIYGSEEKFLL